MLLPIKNSQIEKIQLNQTIIHCIMSRSWTSRLWDFRITFLLDASLLMFVTIFMIFSLVGNFTNFTLLMHHFMFNFPQNRQLVWSGSRHVHMVVWFSWIFSICEVYWKYRTPGHLVFWKPWHWQLTWKIKTVIIVSQNMVSFSEPSVYQTLNLRSMKHFRITWLFLIDICC